MANYDIAELLKLSADERIQIAEDLLESVAREERVPMLSEEVRAELDRRLAEHDADPSTSIPWAVARQRLREEFGA